MAARPRRRRRGARAGRPASRRRSTPRRHRVGTRAVSASSDVARMLTLVPWLLERPGASVVETAEAFGVSPARIRADLGHLDFCGLPGLGGGDLFDVSVVADRIVVEMADELRRPLRPTPAEALRLVLTVDAVAEVLGDDLPALRRAVDRIRDALGVPERVADVLEPATAALTARARQAVATGRRVRLTYQGRGDATPRDREVDPWTLHVVEGRWYLDGHDHGAGERRTFRLDRAVELELLDVEARVPAPAHLDPPRYQPGPDDLEVSLHVTREGRWLADVLDVASVEEGDDGAAVLQLRTDAPRHVIRLVLMAGGAAHVRAPAELAAEVARTAAEAAAAYVTD
ncbi:WYL domain-containing protein [Nitriliruptoraceae bacterium ZYF776]|nr:WYL domain-containing protein [Profundirhabdus halotolerans]